MVNRARRPRGPVPVAKPVQTRLLGVKASESREINPDAVLGARRSKYGAVKTTVNGITFASKAEAARYQVLVIAERAGEIADLELQPSYPLVVNGVKIAMYRADFTYRICLTGKRVVEDVKGMATPVYKLKKKLVKACWGIDVQEVA